MPPTLAQRVQTKNEAIDRFHAEKAAFDQLMGLLKPVLEGVTFQYGSAKCTVSKALKNIEELLADLEDCWVDVGHLPIDDGHWDESSLAEWDSDQRYIRFVERLASQPTIEIPDEFSDLIPKPLTDEFWDFIANNNNPFPSDPEDEVRNAQGRIDDWLEHYGDFLTSVAQNYEYSDDSDSSIVQAIVKNVVGIWKQFERSVSNTAYAF